MMNTASPLSLNNVGDIVEFVKLNKSGRMVPRRVKISGESFNIYEDEKKPGMEYVYNSSIISQPTVSIIIPLPVYGKYKKQIDMKYSLPNLQLKKEEVTANKPLDGSTTTFSFVSYVDEHGGLSQLECLKKCIFDSYATTDWLMDGHDGKHATRGMFCAKGSDHEFLKTQHNVAPQWENHPLLAPAATVFTEHGFVLKRQNIYSPKMPSKSCQFPYYCEGSYPKMRKQWEGHHTSIHQDGKDGRFFLGIQAGSDICFSEDASNNKIILCTNQIEGFRMLDFTECYHTKQQLSEQSGKEETNKYYHQGFVDHDADDVGYTMMFYNKNGTKFDDERRLLLATLLCGLDKMYEQVLKHHPIINEPCTAIVHSLRKKIKRPWNRIPKPPPKPVPPPPTPPPPPKQISKPPSRPDREEEASHVKKSKRA